jgi:phosphoserine phosphatase
MLKGMRDVKVFDFDNTLYHGESSVDLALYMIKNNKRIILYLPKLFYNLFKYKLCNGIRDMLNTENILCSSVDTEKMQVRYLNFGSSKARLYKKKYGSRRIDCFYTDSYNDKSLMELSERVFIVKKGRLKRVK